MLVLSIVYSCHFLCELLFVLGSLHGLSVGLGRSEAVIYPHACFGHNLMLTILAQQQLVVLMAVGALPARYTNGRGRALTPSGPQTG